jgi:uncharacterized membrane protein
MKIGANFGLFKRTREPDRPMIRPEMTPVDWLLEAVALIGLGSLMGYIAYHYPTLPDSIPTHFNAAGIADDYGSKASIFFMLGIALFIYVMMTLMNLIPHMFNYPGKITPTNALRQYTLATRLVRYLKTLIILLFFYISYTTTRVVFNEASGLGLWFLPLFLGLVILPILFYSVIALNKK